MQYSGDLAYTGYGIADINEVTSSPLSVEMVTASRVYRITDGSVVFARWRQCAPDVNTKVGNFHAPGGTCATELRPWAEFR